MQISLKLVKCCKMILRNFEFFLKNIFIHFVSHNLRNYSAAGEAEVN